MLAEDYRIDFKVHGTYADYNKFTECINDMMNAVKRKMKKEEVNDPDVLEYLTRFGGKGERYIANIDYQTYLNSYHCEVSDKNNRVYIFGTKSCIKNFNLCIK